MLRAAQQAVGQFMTIARQARQPHPGLDPSVGTLNLARRLIREEAFETVNALARCQAESRDQITLEAKAKVADGLADTIYVCLWTAEALGIDLAPVFEAVQAANMRKFPDGKALYNDFGKIIKPEGWVGPEADIHEILEAQCSRS